MSRKLKIANHISLDRTPKDSRGRVAVWLTDKKKWAWRSPVDVREMIGMGQASLEAPAGSPMKPTPDNPYGLGVEDETEAADDDEGENVAGAAPHQESKGAFASRPSK